ncbi:MAG: DNA repair protein RadC [Limnochordaceae bacterium]|nr:DNA repair protein RadC [Limnochordaceae bacterium]
MRPRERLVAHGPSALSDAEVLAILLRTGRRGVNAVALAEQVLQSVGGLGGLLAARAPALARVRGVGQAKAAQVLAAVELARRMARHGAGERAHVRQASDVFDLLGVEMGRLDRERFLVVLLDARHQVLRICSVSEGDLSQAPAHPREVFKPAIEHSSAAVILVHNHPSGDPFPSEVDVQLTERLASAGELLGIEVVDHVIIGHGRYSSLRELGLMAQRRMHGQ